MKKLLKKSLNVPIEIFTKLSLFLFRFRMNNEVLGIKNE